MSDTLYQIGEDMHALEDLLMETDGDITEEEVEQQIDQWLEENEARLEVKLDSYGMLIKNRMAISEARKAEAARLLELAKTDANFVDRLKGRLLNFFQVHKRDKVETAKFKFWRQRNGGKTPIGLDPAVQMDPTILPKEFIKMVPQIDTEKIRETLESDVDLAGKERLTGLAWLVERGEHLRIK